jgi:hypothetical protein
VVLPRRIFRFVQSLTEFRTVPEHVARLVGSGAINSEAAGALVRQLCDLTAEGVLLGADRLSPGRGEPPERDQAPPRIETLCTPTRDRPRELERSLSGYAHNLHAWRRRCSLAVFADCTTEASERACREAARRAYDGAPYLERCFAGQRERLAFAEALTKQGLPEGAARFALFGLGWGWRLGANRNAALLHTAGAMFFSADDDTVCDPRVAKSAAADSITLKGESDPTEFWFCADRGAAVDATTPGEADLLGQHEALLGKSLVAAVGKHSGGGVSIDGMCPHLTEALFGATGEIGATFNGLYGDSALTSADKAFWIRNGGTRDRLLASDAALRAALGSREVVRQVPGLTITHGGPFMGTFFGLDNRSLLPPFFPVSVEDGLFGYCAQACRDGFFCAHLPFSLLHAPAERRAYPPDGGHRVPLQDILLCCLSAVPVNVPKRTSEQRIRRLGEQLVDFGASRPADFREFLSCWLWDRAARTAGAMESQLNGQQSAPEHWKGEVRARVAGIRAAIVRPEYLIPREFAQDG